MNKGCHECNKCLMKFPTKYDLNTHFDNTHKRIVDRELSERTKPNLQNFKSSTRTRFQHLQAASLTWMCFSSKGHIYRISLGQFVWPNC